MARALLFTEAKQKTTRIEKEQKNEKEYSIKKNFKANKTVNTALQAQG